MHRIENNMKEFGQYVKDMQGHAQILDLERKLNDVHFRKKRDSIQHQLDRLYAQFAVATQQWHNFDSLKMASQ